ncbi:MAG: hypothetical protein WCE75_07795, partial [Terracidiphilus sp.]
LQAGRRSTRALLAALLRGRWRAVETLADLWSLPLARAVLALLVAALLPFAWVRIYVLVCLAVTLAYAMGSALLGPEPVRDLAALAAAPLYLAWKAVLTPHVLRHARRRAAWVRTERQGGGR